MGVFEGEAQVFADDVPDFDRFIKRSTGNQVRVDGFDPPHKVFVLPKSSHDLGILHIYY